MNYLKFTQYAYLAAAIFFVYTSYERFQEGDEGYWLWLFFAAMCVFMFFFRRRYADRFKNRK